MRSQHSGMALISSMMLMGFLTIVGAALLSSTVIDSKIGMNYRVNLQRVYLAEAGIAAAQEMLRSAVEAKITASTSDAIDTLAEGISEVLKDYDGVDGLMSSSLDVDTLLDTSLTDDVRFADTVSLSAGARQSEPTRCFSETIQPMGRHRTPTRTKSSRLFRSV